MIEENTNLDKIENLINDRNVGFEIRDCCDFMLRFLMGQFTTCISILQSMILKAQLIDAETDKPIDPDEFLKMFVHYLQVHLHTDHVHSQKYIPNMSLTKKDHLYDALRLGELISCNLNYCLHNNCWETRKAFCEPSKSFPDWIQRGNKPHIKLSIEKEFKDEDTGK